MARQVTPQQITKLEAQWRLNRAATINDVVDNNITNEEEILPILMRYNDGFQYQRSFGPLVKAEADYDKNLKESQALEHIQVKWALGLNNRHLASFALSTYETTDLKVAVGDEIILRYSGSAMEPWEGRGFILRLPNSHQEEFTLELNPSKQAPPTTLTTDFTAEFVWKGTSYDRMQQAMKDFATNEESVSSYIYHKLLGHNVAPVELDIKMPKHFSHPKLTELNVSQTNAVRSVLQRPLSLIQGPPGTGKTVTSATIIFHLSQLNREKILVCAPSNVAVDHLAEKLNMTGLKVVRLTAKSREDVESSVSHLALHNMVDNSAKGELKKLIKLKREVGELSSDDSQAYIKLLRVCESRILSKADVVCCTCVGAADKRLAQLKFRTVLIDESTQASEPEVLIPIVKGAKQVILVGDHQQLGPVILDRKAADAGLKQSLFERLVFLGHVPIRLEVQYRMHPCLSEFPSNMFYEGSLQNGVTSDDRVVSGAMFPWPVPETPMMFWANYGREELSGSGNSYLNRVEAMNVERIITRLFKDGIKPEQIGVITPYEGQRAYLVQFMSINSTLLDKRDEYLEVEITSVDAFQGREKDFIILSCVRANDSQSIGFLSDPRRLNVALTRAKYGLLVLGNPRALCRNKLWNHLLIHFREKGCLVDGPLDNLQMSMVQLNNYERKAAKTAAAKERETPLAIPHAPGLKESLWPPLSTTNYTSANTISANFYSKLHKLDEKYEELHASLTESHHTTTTDHTIDYQGLAAESAAATAAAATASAAVAASKRQHRDQEQEQVRERSEFGPSAWHHVHMTNMKNPHRMKLSPEDVKLILYLIVEVKPFKYVGNRSQSQTRKWELIQNKYYDMKLKEQNNTNFIVPTVRTLQRQLVAAIRKGESVRNQQLESGIDTLHAIPNTLAEIDADEYYTFQHITLMSSPEELERALLDLHELSDKIKQLKLESSNLMKGGGGPRIKSSPAISLSNSMELLDTYSSSTTQRLEELSTLLHDQLGRCKEEVQSVSGDFHKAFELLESILVHAHEVQVTMKRDTEFVKAKVNRILELHVEKMERAKEEFLVKQADYGRQIISIFKGEFALSGNEHLANKFANIEEMLE
ncbi:NAM7 [Candida oxycetoniae]|uniref:NAM7 n=1 Tax=Candida oxycetoniae TaxID=497107 RepID=A0AAI9WY49_9ASCO|nr:NAM7 [Candida oxycetoniae]KAI3404907.2 NAM7 [Candida oxycetoniae]